MDPWVITPQERARHMDQFNTTNPVDGFITGAQAKGFFMQSGLPPMMLAQIWGLADMNGDGKMDINEFSVACKLINLKLKGMELPKSLPPQLMNSGAAMGMGGMVHPNSLPLQGGMRPMQPGMQGMGMPGQMGMGMPGMMPGQQRMPGMMPGQMGMQGQMGMGMPGQMPVNSMMGGMGMPGQMGMGGMPQQSMGMSMPGMMPNSNMPGMMTGPGQHPAIPGVQPSVQAPQAAPAPAPAPPPVEWAIPQQKRVGYMSQFQACDKARTGFLAAVQARGVLLQTGLAQQTLATVWNLADIDKDGKLSVEEFIVAMHLCEMGMKGEPLPTQLPLSLVPPNMRRNHPSNISQAGTPGSVKSGEEAMSPASFEDKRRENWEAGQAELTKRRASLLEQQNKEKAERAQKEKEAQEQREKQKREAEAKRQAELEARRQREMELQRIQEEQKRKMEEQREQARKEMERTRLLEWERSRKNELEQHRQRETEKVITLRAKKETLNTEVDNLKGKIEGLSTSIADTRTGVTDVKSFIDGMRSSRDTKMADLNALKTQLKEQNQRLLQVTQEKARIEAKNKVNQQSVEDGRVVELTDFDLKKAEKAEQVEKMRETVAAIKLEEDEKKQELENNKKVLMEHREKLKKMIETCKALHEGFDEKRREVRAEKNKKIRELTDPDHAWGGGDESPTFDTPVAVAAEPDPFAADVDPFAAEPVVAAGHAQVAAVTDLTGYVQYRALYDYEARNPDELAFSVNDIIMVHPGQDHEPGWLGGELNGKVGWFPEAFAERVVEGATDQTLQPIAEVPENGSDSSSFQEIPVAAEEPVNSMVPADINGFPEEPAAAVVTEPVVAESAEPAALLNESYVSVYPYTSDEPGDLIFEAGEYITVTAKNGDWWTGAVGDRGGVFPFNYVEPVPEGGVAEAAADVAPVQVQEDNLAEQNQQMDTTADQSNSDAEDKSGKKLELANVIAPYEATSKEQLSLAKGQMIIVRKKTETGWWQGELQAGGKGKKRAVGWFPASYVKLLAGDAGGTNGNAATEDKPEAATPSSDGAAGGEKHTALFPYTAQYEDELSFEAGDTVMVTAKEEEAWWRGEVGGKSGVFPSNYVEPAKFEVTMAERKRQNLIQELFDTEEKYIDNLKLVFEIFIKPIRSSNMLTKQEISILFINWKDLIITNTKLIKSLRIRRTTEQKQSTVGDILCENFPAMTAYIRFCSSQFSAAALLQKLVEMRPEFDGLLRQCQSHPKVQGMPLSFYLLKPVKRVTEYPLLVEKILKNTPEEHPDFVCIQEALSRAKILCDQVNEGMRMKENSERLEWLQIHVDLHTEEKNLQEKITFNSLTNSVGPRRFLHCGVLQKTKSEKELVGFLFNDFLLLATSSNTFSGHQFSFDKHHNVNLKLYRQPMFLSLLILGPSVRKEEDTVGFSLKLGDTILGLDALSVNDKTLWNSKLSEAISNFAVNEKKFLTKQKSGNIHAYCEASMGSQEQKTAVVTGCNPHWNASMQFLIKDVTQDILCLTVFDRDFFSPNEFLGRTELRVGDIVSGCEERRGPVTRTLKLLEAESGVITVKLDIQMF